MMHRLQAARRIALAEQIMRSAIVHIEGLQISITFEADSESSTDVIMKRLHFQDRPLAGLTLGDEHKAKA